MLTVQAAKWMRSVAAIAMATLAGCSPSQPPDQLRPVTVGEEIYTAVRSPAVVPPAGAGEAQLVWSRTLSHPGATYICPHFSRFVLPDGAYLVVRSPDGARSSTYRGRGKLIDGAPLDEFWAVHIAGAEAVLELYSDRAIGEGAVVMDRFARGLDSFHAPLLELADGTAEAICGADDSDEAKCYQDTESTAYGESRAVARLLINGTGRCTGWLVGSEGHLMTNEHCIGSSSAAANTNYEFSAEGASCSTDCTSGGACPGIVEADGAALVRLSSSLDYALVQLPQNITTEYGYMQLRPTGAVVDERIYIPQHAAGWGKRIAIESGASSDSGGVCRVTTLGAAPCSGSGYNDVGYYCDTRGGSSGSPVLGYGDNLVVALHHCANCPNRGVPIQRIIDDLGTELPPNAVPGGTGDTEPPTVSLDAPADGATVAGVVTVAASAADDVGVSRVEFRVDGAAIGSDSSAPYAISWDSFGSANGAHGLEAVAVDAAGNTASDSVSVDVQNAGGGDVAVYDSALGAPACRDAVSRCASRSLLDGRGAMSGGVEQNAPNTLYGACADGSSGTYHNDESIDGIRVVGDGGELVAGATALVNVDVWVWGASSDHLDLYYTGDATANPPAWTFIATVEPTATGAQTLSASYTLPEGELQAVRASFRYNGSVAPCSGGAYDDADDLAFAVGGDAPVPACAPLYAADFESGADGWAFGADDSTCSTGDWVVGDPSGIVTGGVTTQPEDDHTPGAGANAFFTAANTGAGVDDVDGGVCTGYSATIDASAHARVRVSLWYFHGQRDAGDDPTGDFFRVDASTNGGASYDVPLVAAGDVTSDAVWTELTATIDDPGQLRLRVRAADGGSAGDLVEAGIDDVEVCAVE